MKRCILTRDVMTHQNHETIQRMLQIDQDIARMRLRAWASTGEIDGTVYLSRERRAVKCEPFKFIGAPKGR